MNYPELAEARYFKYQGKGYTMKELEELAKADDDAIPRALPITKEDYHRVMARGYEEMRKR